MCTHLKGNQEPIKVLLKKKKYKQTKRNKNYSSERNAKRHIKAESYFLYSWHRAYNSPYIAYPAFSSFASHLLSSSTSTHTALLFVLLLGLNE